MEHHTKTIRTTQRFIVPLMLLAFMPSAYSAPAGSESLVAKLNQQLEGTWISYKGDSYRTKTFKGREVTFELRSQLGELRFRKNSNIEVFIEDGIAHFAERNNVSKDDSGNVTASENAYVAPFKLAQGRFWEITRSIYLGNNKKAPTVIEMWRADDPGQALLIKARAGDLKAVKKLLDEGTPVDFTSKNSYTALAYAAGCGHKDVVQLLLERGADVNRRSWFEKTPLVVAVQGGHRELVEYLVSEGADVNVRVRHGGGLLRVAAHWGQTGLLDYFETKGIDPKHVAPNGYTALHTAMWRLADGPEDQRAKFVAAAKWLLKRGADPQRTARDGKSPLSYYRKRFGFGGPLANELKGL